MAIRSLPVLLILGSVGACLVCAQTSGGAFRGEVRDASAAVVPHARILIRSVDTGVEIATEANEDGLYITPTLISGEYDLTANRVGFSEELFGPVLLQINQIVRVDFTLKVGATSDSIRVEASGEQMLSTETAEVSQVIARKEVAEIPLNGRKWEQLILLSAGVNPGAPSETGSPNPVNINGQRTKANLYLVDGISTTSSAEGRGNNFDIPLEAIREFSIQAGAYSAEYGNVAGGVVNLQSKSGTNQWHGSAFEFFRNSATDAANFFSNATGQAKNPLHYNQFGGSLGGPIRRDKTFVFADYQGTLTHAGAPMITTVPTDAQRRGDFSSLRDANGALIPIYNPFGASLTRIPFQNNVISPELIDPAAAKLSALLPEPNQFGQNGQPLSVNNYAVTRTTLSAVHSFDIRLDHQFTQISTAFVRYSFQNTRAFTPSIFGLPLGGSISGAGNASARNQNAGIGHIYQIQPTLINEVRLGLTREASALTQEDYGQNLSQQFGIPGVNQSPATSGLSSMVIAGLFNLGGSILTPLRIAATDWNFNEKLTWVKGRHAVRVGFDYQYEIGSTGYLVFGRGEYTFLNFSTSSSAGAGGNAYASFLLGAPYQILRDSFPPGIVGLVSPHYGFYVQDDIKLTPKFTMNLGARYDIMPYPREEHDRLSNFDPATRTMLIAGVNTSERLRDTDYKDVAPRVGLAFAPGSGKTVLRAGYGIGFVDPFGSASVLNSNEFNIPFYFRADITQFPLTAPQYTLSSLLPSMVVPSAASPTGDQRYLVPTDRNQYSQTWSFTVQRALTPSLMFETAYVGTSGNRLLMTSNINAAPPGSTAPAARQPFGPALGEVREFTNSAHSVYHGLQTKLEQRFSRGIYFLGSHTWSKSIDNQSNGTDDSAAGGQYPQNPNNWSLDRGPSSFDRKHRFVASTVWEIPFRPGRRADLVGTSLIRGILGGWQLSGVLTAEAGTPFSVIMPCAAVNSEGNNCRPNLLGSAALSAGQRSVNLWFNAAAFAIPASPAYGDAGRNILRGPGLTNLDAALSKSFFWGTVETRRVQFRSEFFNALNHTNLGQPINSTSSPALGAITSAAPARVIQLGLRLEF